MSLNPDDFVITRKRKKYKFARFAHFENCYEATEITPDQINELAGNKEIILEIGAGTALFSVELARRHPERFFIATDVKADRLQTGAKLALADKIENIIFIRLHTMQVSSMLRPRSVSAIWLTFSDPFPKTRQAKHRLTHPNFLKQYRSVLKPEGILHQKTDNHALFDYSLEQFVTDDWRLRELTYDLHESKLNSDYKIMTTFETKFASQGLPIYLVSASL